MSSFERCLMLTHDSHTSQAGVWLTSHGGLWSTTCGGNIAVWRSEANLWRRCSWVRTADCWHFTFRGTEARIWFDQELFEMVTSYSLHYLKALDLAKPPVSVNRNQALACKAGSGNNSNSSQDLVSKVLLVRG